MNWNEMSVGYQVEAILIWIFYTTLILCFVYSVYHGMNHVREKSFEKLSNNAKMTHFVMVPGVIVYKTVIISELYRFCDAEHCVENLSYLHSMSISLFITDTIGYIFLVLNVLFIFYSQCVAMGASSNLFEHLYVSERAFKIVVLISGFQYTAAQLLGTFLSVSYDDFRYTVITMISRLIFVITQVFMALFTFGRVRSLLIISLDQMENDIKQASEFRRIAENCDSNSNDKKYFTGVRDVRRRSIVSLVERQQYDLEPTKTHISALTKTVLGFIIVSSCVFILDLWLVTTMFPSEPVSYYHSQLVIKSHSYKWGAHLYYFVDFAVCFICFYIFPISSNTLVK